jgi:hypothetical protein
MRRQHVEKVVVLMTVALVLALAGCDSGEPVGATLLAADGQALESRSPRADEVANNPLMRTTLIGNSITGAAGAIRDFNAAGAPWVIDPRSEAVLTARGELRIDVRGLVLAAGPNIGINPQPFFRARVSCLVVMAAALVEVNVTTDQFPASPAGDSRIRAMVDLPDECLAPVIFVTNQGGTAWFAVSGV